MIHTQYKPFAKLVTNAITKISQSHEKRLHKYSNIKAIQLLNGAEAVPTNTNNTVTKYFSCCEITANHAGMNSLHFLDVDVSLTQ